MSQFPQNAVQSHTSSGQFLQFSASSITPFPQNAVHGHTSSEQFWQFSHSSISPFPQSQQIHPSIGHVSHVSRGSNLPFPQHSHASRGQFKQFSHSSTSPFPHVENAQHSCKLTFGHPVTEFHGTSTHWSILSGIPSWSVS